MKHFIEDYRNNQIFYNEDTDKFVCEILSDDELKPKTMNRASLVDVRKAIDDYIKRNSTFKPFKAILSRYSDDATPVTITSIRKDGGLVVENPDGTKLQLVPSRYSDLESLYKYSEEWLNEKNKIDKEISNLEKKQIQLRQSYMDKKPEKLDLSFINDFK